MLPLPYDEDELIRRLREECSCTVTKEKGQFAFRGERAGTTVIETWLVVRGAYIGTLRIRDTSRPLYDYEVASVLRQIRMTPAEAYKVFQVDLEPVAARVRGKGRIE